MIKKNKKMNIYLKLFKFKNFFNNINFLINQPQIVNLFKIFRILMFLKNFIIFIPQILNIKSNWIFSIWKKGFISNFFNLKWYFNNIYFLKKLPTIIINLTNDKTISLEVLKKNIPLINIFEINNKLFNIKNRSDYFLNKTNFSISLDNIFLFIKVFKFIKNYKNV